MSQPFLKIILLVIMITISAGSCLASGAAAFEPAAVDPATLRHQLRDILNDSHFAYLNPWIWVSRIVQFIKNLFSFIPTTPNQPSPGFITILKWLAILIAASVLFWLFRYGGHLLHREIRIKQAPSVAPARPVSAANLEDQAIEQAAQEKFREAVRLLYLACLTRFREQGLIAQTATRPDRENLKAILRVWGTEHPAGLAFAGLIGLFQEKWYGLKSCDHHDYQQGLELAHLIRARLKDADR